MASDTIHGLDTSVVLRLLTGQPPSLASRAIAFLAESVANGHKVIVSDLVICEAYFALHTHYGVPKREAVTALARMLDEGPVEAMADSRIRTVLQTTIQGSQKPGFVDRLIHAQYDAARAGLVSFEKATRRLTNARIL